MHDIKQRKEVLRKQLLLRRLGLHSSKVSEISKLIARNLFEIGFVKTVKSVLLYLPINNEVETADIFYHFEKVGADICLPGYFAGEWAISKFHSLNNLETGPFGTLQPKNLEKPNRVLDLVIIPAVGFSRKLVRLGYGKGVYDRLLSGSAASKIGLGYDFQVLDDLPYEKHDLKMDYVVTESGVLKRE